MIPRLPCCDDKFFPLIFPPNFSLGEIFKRFPGSVQCCSICGWSCALAVWALPELLENTRVTGFYLPKFAYKSSLIYPLICSLRSAWCKRLTPRRCTPWNTWTNWSVWSVMKWEMFSRSCRLCRAWSTLSWLIYGKRWLLGSLVESAQSIRDTFETRPSSSSSSLSWEQLVCSTDWGSCFRGILFS